MKIAIDLDDTLADSLTSFIEFHNKRYKTKLRYEDFTAYTLNEIMGMPKEEEARRLKEFDDSNYNDEVKPLKDAVNAIEELGKNHTISVITSRPKKIEEKTRKWINANVPLVKEVIFTRKEHNGRTKSKGEICMEIGADVLIDDNFEHALECEKAGVRCIVLDYPWNRKYKLGRCMLRAMSWKEVVRIIERWEKD